VITANNFVLFVAVKLLVSAFSFVLLHYLDSFKYVRVERPLMCGYFVRHSYVKSKIL